MGRAVESYQESLDRATSSRSSDGVPNVAVIAADKDGSRDSLIVYRVTKIDNY
jgi:hypothetical protein